MLEAEIRGLQELQRKHEQVIADLHGVPMVRAMREATLLVQNDAKRLAPVDRGPLRASLVPEVRSEGASVLGVVGSNILYAPYQETGTRPFWPPLRALEVWARRHGTSAYLVARAIARRGIRPKRYLQSAFTQNKPRIVRLIGDAVGEIVAK